MKNWGVPVEGEDCDAIVACPVGAEFTASFGEAIGILGNDRPVFAGGYLDPNWYVRYKLDDNLLGGLPSGESYRWGGLQVMGDAGDLTSNC